MKLAKLHDIEFKAWHVVGALAALFVVAFVQASAAAIVGLLF